MGPRVIAELEDFVERGDMWNVPAMERLVEVLEAEHAETADPLPLMLAKVFAAILLRTTMAPIDERRRYDVQAHVYQRLYKVLEACYDDLPASEIRTRIEVFHRRLSRIIVDEDPRPVAPG